MKKAETPLEVYSFFILQEEASCEKVIRGDHLFILLIPPAITNMEENKTLEIIKDTQLSRGGLSVVLFLLNIGGIWSRGQRELAHELGVSQRQLLDNLSNLEHLGYIIKERDPKRMNTKIYKIKEEKND